MQKPEHPIAVTNAPAHGFKVSREIGVASYRHFSRTNLHMVVIFSLSNP
jgi:hypothetical protein